MTEKRLEEITVKTSLPPSPLSLPELNSPVIDPNIKEIKQGVEDVEWRATSKMSPEDRAKRKAMIVTALERGVINDRMDVPLPDNLYGCWVRRDQMDVDAMKKLGFSVDTKYAVERSLHSDGTGAAIVGDVLYMITERENKELIDEVKHERFLAMHAPKKGASKEEQEFAAQTAKMTGGIIPTTIESKTREARKDDIASVLDSMASQTQPQTRG